MFQGLQFLTEAKDSDMVGKSKDMVKIDGLDNLSGEKVKPMKTRIHRTYPVGFSLTRDLIGSGI